MMCHIESMIIRWSKMDTNSNILDGNISAQYITEWNIFAPGLGQECLSWMSATNDGVSQTVLCFNAVEPLALLNRTNRSAVRRVQRYSYAQISASPILLLCFNKRFIYSTQYVNMLSAGNRGICRLNEIVCKLERYWTEILYTLHFRGCLLGAVYTMVDYVLLL